MRPAPFSLLPVDADRRGRGDQRVDPLSDLLFTMVAILLLVFMTLLPGMVMSGNQGQSRQVAEARSLGTFDLDLHGVSVTPYLAVRTGIVRSGKPPIGLEGITGSASLSDELASQITRGEAVVLLIAPHGLEAAFEFEALAAAKRLQRLHQIRLDAGCRLADQTSPILECLGAGGPAP